MRAGQVAQGLDLVAGNAGGAEGLIGRVEQELRRGIAAKVLADTPVDGGRGLAVQLLVKDRLEQRLERRGRRIEAEREGAGAIDERGKFCVAGPEMLERLGGIEGKFAAAAVVNHGRSVTYGSHPMPAEAPLRRFNLKSPESPGCAVVVRPQPTEEAGRQLV